MILKRFVNEIETLYELFKAIFINGGCDLHQVANNCNFLFLMFACLA